MRRGEETCEERGGDMRRGEETCEERGGDMWGEGRRHVRRGEET